jgi:hypothetical protein
MNKLLTIAAFALAALTTTPALAGTLTGEYRSASKPDTAGADFALSGVNVGPVAIGAEVQTVQAPHTGAVSALYSVNATKTFASVSGFAPQVGVEFGKSASTGKNFNFWGLGAGVSHAVAGPVSASVGYRHREGFTDRKLDENRLSAGLTYAVSAATSLGLNYYRYEEKFVPKKTSKTSEVVGFAVSHSF